MSGKANKAFTKEEELLLQDFSRNVSTKSSALFYGNAFIVSAIPIWLFWRVHALEVSSSLAWFAMVTTASTWLLALAYRNTKFQLKHRVAVRREDAVAREMARKLADDKKMSRKEKDERILWKKNEVADYEATTYSIFYNNALFLTIVILSSFYILRSFTPTVYPFTNYKPAYTMMGQYHDHSAVKVLFNFYIYMCHSLRVVLEGACPGHIVLYFCTMDS